MYEVQRKALGNGTAVHTSHCQGQSHIPLHTFPVKEALESLLRILYIKCLPVLLKIQGNGVLFSLVLYSILTCRAQERTNVL